MTSLHNAIIPPENPSSLGSSLDKNANGFSISLYPTIQNETPAVIEASGVINASSDPGPEMSTRVVVVGAGISGLRCATTLQRHGVEVSVLEGRDRIGGRIHTTHTGQGPRDIGAAWMHETSQNKLVKLISKLGIDYYYDDGLPLYYTEQGRAGAQFKAKKVADEFADHCEWFYENHPDALDRNVSSFVNEFVQNHDLITKDERQWAPQAVKEVELWLGTSVDQASSKHLSYFITERNLYMKGGYDSIVKWTAKPLLETSDVIFLNHTVQEIHWHKDDQANACEVHCQTADHSMVVFRADAVVCTIPLGALRQNLISFQPELPADIRAGISKFSYGALGKVFFEFADVFWSKENDQFVFYPSPPGLADDEDSAHSSSAGSTGPTEQDNILNYATVTINLWIMTGSKELCVQIAEPLTQRIEASTDKKLIYRFFEPLFKLLRTEPYKALPRLVNVETTHWTQDPLAGFGSYSADKVGDEPELFFDALDNHKSSRLQFAGEHCTSVANGCVHGAFATGEMAARNLLRTFGIQQDAGDLVSII